MNETTITEESKTPQPLTEMQQLAATIAATANENAALKNEITKIQGNLKSQESYTKMYQEASSQKEAELNSLHAMLDCLPGAPPRKIETSERYGEFVLNVQARFTCWLAGQLKK